MALRRISNKPLSEPTLAQFTDIYVALGLNELTSTALAWYHARSDCLVVAFNTLRSRQNGRHFADDTFKCIFVNENV